MAHWHGFAGTAPQRIAGPRGAKRTGLEDVFVYETRGKECTTSPEDTCKGFEPSTGLGGEDGFFVLKVRHADDDMDVTSSTTNTAEDFAGTCSTLATLALGGRSTHADDRHFGRSLGVARGTCTFPTETNSNDVGGFWN